MTTMTARRCPRQDLVDQHFGGRIRPPDERALREHLPGCERCRGYYDRHLLLARLDPRAPDAETRLARGLGFGAAPPARSRLAWAVPLAAAAAVVLLVLLWPRATAPPGGFQARGGAGDHGGATAILVYRVRPGGPPELLHDGDAIGATDELAVAYRNAAGRKRLLVFGVDESGRVYWYHPAWVDRAESPVAVPIEPGGPRELPEAITHRLSGSRLTIHGVFTDRALTVRQVEAALRSGRLVVEGAIRRAVTLNVRRGGD